MSSEPGAGDGGSREILGRRSPYLAAACSRFDLELESAVSGAYLLYRSLDDVEDTPDLTPVERARVLLELSQLLDRGAVEEAGAAIRTVPNVSEIGAGFERWHQLIPAALRGATLRDASRFAGRAAAWARTEWRLDTERRFATYVHEVAATGLTFSRIWEWRHGVVLDRRLTIGYASYAQLVDLAFDREEDLARGMDLLPRGWDVGDLLDRAELLRPIAVAYVEDLPGGQARQACAALLALFERRAAWCRSGVEPRSQAERAHHQRAD